MHYTSPLIFCLAWRSEGAGAEWGQGVYFPGSVPSRLPWGGRVPGWGPCSSLVALFLGPSPSRPVTAPSSPRAGDDKSPGLPGEGWHLCPSQFPFLIGILKNRPSCNCANLRVPSASYWDAVRHSRHLSMSIFRYLLNIMKISKYSQTLILEKLSRPTLKLVMKMVDSIAMTTNYLGEMILVFYFHNISVDLY